MLKSISDHDASLQLKLTEQQMEQSWNYYKAIQEKISEIQELQEFFSKQLQTAYQMIEKGTETSNKQALGLLQTLKSRINSTKPFYFCKHPILNSILEEYYNRTEQFNISFYVDLQSIDSNFIDYSDICLIFSLLLSDALHEVQKDLKNIKKPFISISTNFKSNFFIIKETHSILYSKESKENQELEDYKALILNITKKYQGDFDIKKSDFKSYITLFFSISKNKL